MTDLGAQLAALHMDPLGCKGFSDSILASGLAECKRELCFLLRTLMMRHSKQAVQVRRSLFSCPPAVLLARTVFSQIPSKRFRFFAPTS